MWISDLVRIVGAGVSGQPQARSRARSPTKIRLRSWRVTRRVDDLLRLFLISFLEHNGYHDSAVAIDDVLAVWDRS
jgi:hypothetical protein